MHSTHTRTRVVGWERSHMIAGAMFEQAGAQVSAAEESIFFHDSRYSAGWGSLPVMAATVASSAEAR